MRVGIIGCGVVGGTLAKWFNKKTAHDIRRVDPALGFNDPLDGCEAIFVSVPVPAAARGQDTANLESAVALAKSYTENVFIRSTVLPGTNDRLGTIAMPEFLTERRALEDFEELPILLGPLKTDLAIEKIFPNKKIYFMPNVDAELSKFTHNCFGAFKVTYFNIIEELSRKLGADYQNVLIGSGLTGFIERTHTMVPGPDGLRGYGGKCFPENVDAMRRFLQDGRLSMLGAQSFFETMKALNELHRAPFLRQFEESKHEHEGYA